MSHDRERSLAHLLFALSGFCALVYETVWSRQLVLVFGATVHSASTVLAGMMTGFALGAVAAPALLRRFGPPLRLYGFLELGVAGCAAAFPLALQGVLAVLERTDMPAGPVRLFLSFAVLLPPTVLMGATFPVLSELVVGDDPGRDIGPLYAANLLGACLGALAGAFLLFAFLGLAGSNWAAVGLNLAVAAAALAAARGRAAPSPALDPPRPDPPDVAPRWPALALFLSGVCGMALEVVWTRILLPSFNNSAYGFACVLFVFLLGLGLGSLAAGRGRARGAGFVAGAQVLAALFSFVGYLTFELTQLLLMRYADVATSGVKPALLGPLAEATAVLLPAAVLQGMVLPAALSAFPRRGIASAVGRLYFWNTLGGIVGALAAGFWWIPAFGVQSALLAVVGVSAAAGCLLFAGAAPAGPRRWAVPAAVAAAYALACLTLAGRHLPSEMRRAWVERASGGSSILHYEDGLEASVAVMSTGGARTLLINGVGVATVTHATKMMAHIPLLLHPDPRRTLVICFGIGTTFRSALQHPGSVTVVDLVPAVFAAFRFFHPDAERWLSDPRARVLANDGRNHLLREREGYDVVVVDPSPPLYAAGTVNIYDQDFYALAKRKLKPGGILAVWLPFYPESEYQMVMKSFLTSFPHTQVWNASLDGGGILMLGSGSPISEDRALLAKRFKRPEVRQDILVDDAAFAEDETFWKLYLGPGERFKDYLAAAPVVTDAYPWIEYPYFRSRRDDYLRPPAFLSWPPYNPSAGL